jgi:hypothetical protein
MARHLSAVGLASGSVYFIHNEEATHHDHHDTTTTTRQPSMSADVADRA